MHREFVRKKNLQRNKYVVTLEPFLKCVCVFIISSYCQIATQRLKTIAHFNRSTERIFSFQITISNLSISPNMLSKFVN